MPAHVGGMTAWTHDFVSAVYGSFPEMLALLALISFLLLARAFRSVVLPLKALALNVLSIGAAWGVVVLVWQEGHGSHLLAALPATHATTAWIPLIVFAFLFGLSMDYEVFILARMREEFDRTGSTSLAVVGRARPHRPPRHERGADPLPHLRRDGLRPRHGREDARHRLRRRDPARRDDRPRPARAGPGRAARPLELVVPGPVRPPAPCRRTAARAAAAGDA